MKIFKVDEELLHDACAGICLACGDITESGIEPDAREYHCDACGLNQVHGLEEALVMGRIDIIEESEE